MLSFGQKFGRFLGGAVLAGAGLLTGVNASAQTQFNSLKPTAPVATRDPVEAVGDDFEALMLQMLYNQMLQGNRLVSPGDDNPFAPSHGEMIFKSMQDQAMMQQMATRRPLGIGSLVARQLKGQTGIGTRNLLNSGLGPRSQIGKKLESEK